MFRRHHFAIVAMLTIIATLAAAGEAMAYIGPGGGMEFIGYAMGLIAMLGAAFVSFVLWPFYKFLGWLRGAKTTVTLDPSAAAAPVADPAATPSPMATSDNGPTTPPAAVVAGDTAGRTNS